jgi:hypothetical protein
VLGLSRRTIANRFKKKRHATVPLMAHEESETIDLTIPTLRREPTPYDHYACGGGSRFTTFRGMTSSGGNFRDVPPNHARSMTAQLTRPHLIKSNLLYRARRASPRVVQCACRQRGAAERSSSRPMRDDALFASDPGNPRLVAAPQPARGGSGPARVRLRVHQPWQRVGWPLFRRGRPFPRPAQHGLGTRNRCIWTRSRLGRGGAAVASIDFPAWARASASRRSPARSPAVLFHASRAADRTGVTTGCALDAAWARRRRRSLRDLRRLQPVPSSMTFGVDPGRERPQPPPEEAWDRPRRIRCATRAAPRLLLRTAPPGSDRPRSARGASRRRGEKQLPVRRLPRRASGKALKAMWFFTRLSAAGR